MKKTTPLIKKVSLSLLSISCASTVALNSKAEASEQQATEKPENLFIEEVLVTAQKRGEQKLQNVPISISVLSGNSLDASRFQGVSESLTQVAGLSQRGGTSDASISIRGVSSAAELFTGSSTVGYYVDSVPFSLITSAIVPDANAYDLERVEVLRGPQGTLYGSTALNGVVRILTKDANLDEHEFKARTSLSNTQSGGDNYRGDLAVNVPIVPGKLAARAVIGYNDQSGWIDQPGVDKDDVNSSQLQNYRLKINTQPTENLSMKFSAWASRVDYDGAEGAVANSKGISPSLALEKKFVDYDLYSLTVSYDFPSFTVSSSTSYIDYNSTSTHDFFDLGIFPLTTIYTSEIFSEEIRLNSTMDGTWQWSLGGFYREGKDGLNQNIPGVLPAPLDRSFNSESHAVFGELTRSFMNDELELTVGLRYFEDEVRSTESVRLNLDGKPLYDETEAFDAVTPRIVLTWYPNENLTVYGSYSEGFRSGFSVGPDAADIAPTLPPVEEDTLKNYEVGSKGSLLNGRLGFDLALYYIDWQDVQQPITLILPSGLDVSATVNGESASGVGFDMGLTATLTEGLRLGLSFGWNDLTIDNDIVSGGLLLFNEGDRVNGSTEYTAGITSDYVFSFGGGLEGVLSGSINYQSPGEERALFTGVIIKDDSNYLTTARLSFSIRSSVQHWDATVFVDNLTNEDGAISGRPSDLLADVRMRPRTAGLQFEYHY